MWGYRQRVIGQQIKIFHLLFDYLVPATHPKLEKLYRVDGLPDREN
jgi:hypothetical protein